MSREDGDAWCAVADLDGWGEEWERTAWLCAEFHNSLVSLVRKLRQFPDIEIDVDDFRWAPDYRPRHKWERKPPRPTGGGENQVTQALSKMVKELDN